MATDQPAPIGQKDQQPFPLGKLVLLSLCMLVVITVEVGPVGVLPHIAADLRVPQSRAALLVSCYAITVVLASVPAIRLLDRFDRRQVLMLSMSAFAVSTAALAVTRSLPLAVAARVIGGFGHAIFFGVGIDITHRLSPAKRMVPAVAIFFSGNVLALALAVPAVAAAGGSGWRGTFLALAGSAGACVVAARLLLPALPSGKADAPPLAGGARRPFFPWPDRPAATVCLFGLVWLTGHFLAFTLLRAELTAAGFPDRLAPALLMAYGIGTLAGTGLAGAVATHRLRGAIAVGFLLLCGAQLCLWSLLPSMWPSFAAAALWGIGFGAIPTLNSSAILHYSRVSPDMTASMLSSACNIGISLGSFASGLVYQNLGHDSAFLLAAGIFVVGALATRSLHKDGPREGLGLTRGARAEGPAQGPR
ncbi:major facilitator superfamily MFS_1 [Segniliparus rotundus DSM 44985]|uniref:Major facilitator superfamily MFS_1 n=1 Tax=Segniliparus rotundus (strain ATCC BAA-972 / CDC 1076 / CIP 108378 / DSM 44985 / JCM 13578) TaxID=640132 RepID=D6ZCK8_SEGRD|nr:MFS transporter [Segniliparus rotundus]ADG97050.1 major facilitator superfamily MFS_1 [Segniliparus rotundus DSM 44985]